MLTKEEVLHIASLAKIKLKADEVKEYQVKLKQIMDDIDSILDVPLVTDELLFSTTPNINQYREDDPTEPLPLSDVLKNAPEHTGNFIEVEGALND